MLVGDASAYTNLRPMVGRALGSDPTAWLLPEGMEPPSGSTLPDDANVCSCNNVTAGTIRGAVTDHQCTDIAAVKACTKAGTSCGSCVSLVKKLMETQMAEEGLEVSTALCEHFSLTRAQLFDIVRVSEISTFSELIDKHGTGRGCDICRPVVASILASLGKGHVLDGENAALQDTNDHVMANLQKDGTYSVVPRIPGGEVTPGRPHRDRPGRRRLRALHQDHRRPAHRPVRRPHRAAARDLEAARRRRASSPGMRTASRCAP